MFPPTALPEFLADLRQQVAGEVRSDAFSRIFYSTDASLYQVMPHGVLIPRGVEDVQAAVTLAVRHGIPILPRGAGTSLAGQAVNAALVIDGSRHLDQILEVNPDERWVRVQPGVVLDDLNRHLRPLGLQFGPDPASSDRATMGGVVSNNATGSHSILYGMTADHVLEAEVILADGSTTIFGPLDDDALAERRRRDGLAGAIHRDIAALTSDPANQAAIRAGTPRHWRRAGGYNLDRFVGEGVAFHHPTDPRFNLARLICGAEGTLAAITALKLGLVPVPARTGLALIHFQDLRQALLAVQIILAAEPSAVELLDSLGLQLCRDVPTYARLLATFLDTVPEALLIVEFQGESESELRHKVDRLQERLMAEKAGVVAFVPALDPARQANVWQVRKASLGLVMSLKGDVKPVPFIEDAAVPVEHLADYVDEIDRYLAGIGTRATYYAHASAGCLHIRPLINTKLAREVAKMPDIARFSASLLRGYGGALSSEHGDGRTRSWLNEAFFGPELYRLYESVKRIFDPAGIFNPGNIVPSKLIPGELAPDKLVPNQLVPNQPVTVLPMTAYLRYGEDYHVVPHESQLDFSAEQGFDRAVEMCNGAGVCRKRASGAMCPSFMVTREEEHSTRGRANALRAAMSGLLPADALTSPRMYQVMDLCIECKACKAECPSAVDMAKLKFEFLARYHAAHGTPLRARLFGDIARISRLSSGRMAPLANWGLGNGIVRGLLERFVGISRRRQLPVFAREPFTAWFAGRGGRGAVGTQGRDCLVGQPPPPSPSPKKAGGGEDARRVVLFNDTFNTYNTPEVAIAATELLEATGFEVMLPGHRCCGRPMISKGLVEQARDAARDTVERLAPFAALGLPIVGLEPSCLLTLRDEYAYLLPGDPRVPQIADCSLTFEEFIAREADAGRLEWVFADEPRRVLLHSHCHQKALVGSGPSRRVLSLPPGYTVDEVDSGCCGMAGSFGYEAEHYEISLAMAERRLLPAVRAADPDTVIVAAGTSCRQQIAHGSGRRAWHPAEVLRGALRKA
jgi:FAD/FMN-containing dehydrogenase/Fe-S oxidoreductase